ncbi:MAG: DUF6973 domain-containing protein [Flavicella sp.]
MNYTLEQSTKSYFLKLKTFKINRKINYFTTKLLAVITLFQFCACGSYHQKLSKVSVHEKKWALLHPFQIKRAIRLSKQAQRVADSIKKTNALDKDANGGQVDAFRHAFWMSTLSQGIGYRSARSLGKAHEKTNYEQFKKGENEDGGLPDAAATEMDLYNNEFGISLYKENKKANKETYIALILQAIHDGKLRILQKDKEGSYLDCEGKKLALKHKVKKWENNKCLVPSKK